MIKTIDLKNRQNELEQEIKQIEEQIKILGVEQVKRMGAYEEISKILQQSEEEVDKLNGGEKADNKKKADTK